MIYRNVVKREAKWGFLSYPSYFELLDCGHTLKKYERKEPTAKRRRCPYCEQSPAANAEVES